MKKLFIIPAIAGLTAGIFLLAAFTGKNEISPEKRILREIPKGCAFRIVMGEENSDSGFAYHTPDWVGLN